MGLRRNLAMAVTHLIEMAQALAEDALDAVEHPLRPDPANPAL